MINGDHGGAASLRLVAREIVCGDKNVRRPLGIGGGNPYLPGEDAAVAYGDAAVNARKCHGREIRHAVKVLYFDAYFNDIPRFKILF